MERRKPELHFFFGSRRLYIEREKQRYALKIIDVIVNQRRAEIAKSAL
jgi:hypothetical protein